MGSLLGRSEWLKAIVFSMACTLLFLIFFAAIPSAFISWTDGISLVTSHSAGTALGPRIRDVFVVGYYGAITPVTFVLFSLYQRMHPVNADPDEPKRESGGYR
ncbi:MAG: hypothetical protein ABR520_05175 [Mycobacteriales bacterium]